MFKFRIDPIDPINFEVIARTVTLRARDNLEAIDLWFSPDSVIKVDTNHVLNQMSGPNLKALPPHKIKNAYIAIKNGTIPEINLLMVTKIG